MWSKTSEYQVGITPWTCLMSQMVTIKSLICWTFLHSLTEGLSGLYVFLFYTMYVCMHATIAILVFKNEVSEIVSLLLNMYMYV